MKEQIKPGTFGTHYFADDFRIPYDILNEQVLSSGKSVDYLFVGDSITQHWNLSLFFDDLGQIQNRGIGSDVTKIILARSDADVFQLKPKNVVYLAGINDLITTCPDLWKRTDGADKDEVIDDIEKNIEGFIIKCNNNNVKAYICSVLPTDFCVPYNSFGLEDMIIVVNDKIKALCEKYNVSYVDYYSHLCAEDMKKINCQYTHDGVHPNFEAYSIMANVLKAAIFGQKL